MAEDIDMNYLVLVFCDTEKNNPDYQKLKQDLDDYFGFPVCGRLVFYVSPCTMLVIANHFVGEDEEPIRLTKVSKSESGKFLSQHEIPLLPLRLGDLLDALSFVCFGPAAVSGI